MRFLRKNASWLVARQVLLWWVVSASCAPVPAPKCTPGSCPTGQHCVFATGPNDPRCTEACSLDGGCTAGTCACRPYSTTTQDCVLVCQ